MNILSAEGISKSYSEKILFNDISLGIGEGDKIGLIGVNGTGKSTLLKAIAGIETVDTGNIIKSNKVRVGYLEQSPAFEPGTTVLQQVFNGHSPVMVLLREYEDILLKSSQKPADEKLEKRLLDLMHQMDTMNAWTLESEAKTILTRLGIDSFEADVATLSGGQRKRIAMAGALINPTELLILDEPTNHIDNDTVDWLEKYLNTRKGALLMVTHDRYFLDRVANRIIELDNGKLYSYQANYSRFLEMKAEREELEQASERKRQNLFRNELEWIRRGAQARSTKQKARIERFEKLKDADAPKQDENIEIQVGAARLGRKIIELENIKKSYDDKTLINDFSYVLLRDDRIGIIGPNGIGKSTLLKVLSGQIAPDSGKVEIGETVKTGFFTQENTDMDQNLRVIEYIRTVAEHIETANGSLSASQMLERFLFPPSVQWTPISKLSGGEKRRLYLLSILMGAPNILLLDEPTNDLDIQTLTILEAYLDEFPGAVITVSHDRYFLDRMANRIFSFEGNGEITKYAGNYSDYREYAAGREKQDGTERAADPDKNSNSSQNKTEWQKNKEKPLKFTFKEQKEFDEIDDVIAALESDIENVKKDIDKSATDFSKLQELLLKQQELEKELDLKMERWTYLNELAEKIENSKKK
ncbi:ABC transporter related protein [Ruminiclostridium papyrosolvens DSM 2782]|uniref:ABC transporter related protein n=1 Tax=Ruminiclostridium papyrosolvens DSM 2782 TaxID=588581 RepID=F1TCS4_9FIRM|nr:ABC-F family ATP-binding cassette domain-containing protein [Ruminiclostridium papyrosolvens]EGD47791.1 ABC transporter related protein [Ruminiclostridium papyrosolvens DSM 2782]WES34508.1 ABC-F family ATP-binding cassette domain-containing protein [Ruminiclostridium papyrosolvens DSM 2782]